MGWSREKEMLQRVLKQYRTLTNLWNRNDEHFNNKVKRSESYLELLKTYREFEPSATVRELRKKIQNMRTNYRKMQQKVLQAKADSKVFEPTLWYYRDLKFLDECNSDQISENEHFEEADDDEEDEEESNIKSDIRSNTSSSSKKLEMECLKTDSRSISPPPMKKRTPNFVFVNENVAPCVPANLPTFMDHNSRNNLEISSSTEYFGKTVASQLNELQQYQRFIAEKLIADVIFNARLERLCPESSIRLNNE